MTLTPTPMTIPPTNTPVTMALSTLAAVPRYPVPAGVSIRPYTPGDEHVWVQIQLAADRYNTISLDLFHREFGRDATLLARRMFFLVNAEGRAVGTAAAWFDDNHLGRSFGRVHWVAIRPEYQGRGLSKPLLSKACSALRALGHEEAYLTTSTARIPAISLYLKFGFLPEINRMEDARIWKEMEEHLPGLSNRGNRPLTPPSA